MDRLFKRVIALLLVMTLTSANLILLGNYTVSYALSNNAIEQQTTETESENVEFNVYLKDGKHIQTLDADSNNLKLYINVKVKKAGYLKNSEITFENANFKISEEVQSDYIQNIDADNYKITLKQINNGSDVTIEIPIEILNSDKVSIDNFSKEFKTIYKGKYIDGVGKEKGISKEIVNKLSWIREAEVKSGIELTKYIPYKQNGKYGVLIQVRVSSGVKESRLPIKNTNLEVTAPKINNLNPSFVTVIATNTAATNGEETGVNFTNKNYSYNEEKNLVKINTSNYADNNGQISWLKNVEDEYLVTFVFEGNEVYEYALANGIDSKVQVSSELIVYSETEKSLTKTSSELIIRENQRLGDITDYNILAQNEIQKGYIYANYNLDEKNETNYWVKYRVTINNINLVDEIKLEQQYDLMLTENASVASTTVSGKNYVYNKLVKVDEKEFIKILGETGNIEVLNENGEKIGNINKSTNYEINIASLDNNKIVIKTTKPIEVGTIDFIVEKAIKGNIDYSKEQMKTFVKLRTGIENVQYDILLKEPTSVSQIEISKKDLSTVIKNENIEIRAVLDTSSTKYALYENPILKIQMPSYIKQVEIKSTDILLDSNDLKIKNVKVEKENGSQVIYVTLEGIQKEYTINAKYKGAIVVLNTNIEVDMFAPGGTQKIVMTCTNQNTVSSNSIFTNSTEVNFIAPKDLVVTNGVNDIISVLDETKNIGIRPYSTKQVVTINGKIINNYPNSISNIVVLGRLPVKGNKVIDTAKDLESTFDTTLKSVITLNGVNNEKYTVYYSNNVNATKDVLDVNNNWTKVQTENAKSYLIVFNDFKLETKQVIDFSYNVEIPENLKHRNYVSEMYKVYYTNNSTIGNIDETKVSPIIKLTTGQGPDLSAELKSTVDVVRQGQIVKMVATVKNIGDVTATNVRVNIQLPEYSSFVECIGGQGIYDEDINMKTITIGELKAGEERIVSYNIRISDGKTQLPKEIINTLDVVFDELPEGISSNECKLNVQKGDIAIELYSPVPDSQILKEDDVIEYRMTITNISQKDVLQNSVVIVNIPEGMKFESVLVEDGETGEITNNAKYDENSRELRITLDTINNYKYVDLRLKVGNPEEKVSIMARVRADSVEEAYSNVVEYKVAKVELETSELTSSSRYVKEGEELIYSITIKNKSIVSVSGLQIIDELPEGLQFKKATYTYGKNGNKVSIVNMSEGKVIININTLEAGEETKIDIITKANLLPNKDDKEIQNSIIISANGMEDVRTNSVVNVIEYNEELHQVENDDEEDNGEGDNEQDNENQQPTPEIPSDKTYKITGTAWVDANKNGKKEVEEQVLSNVSVLLLYKKDNSIVKDVDTGEEKRTITGEDGKYQIDNLLEDEYIVVFVYDASRYSLTRYQVNGVEESSNSDAIGMNIVIDGERRVVGMTDIINITDSNVRDIDLGVYASEKFDLRIDKYINKITLTTPTIGTKTYDYTNKKVAKIEILAKNVGQSSIVIEYKIVVTNEGAVSGYAKKIVDYLPENLKFNTELNKDWYLSDNGNVYNSSLENVKINPGESKELKLIATMKITENTLDVLNNNVEIYESYNEEGLEDIDSAPANKMGDEDDMSQADVVVSLVTGTIIKYITVALGVITILGLGIYGIKAKVLVKKKRRRI